MDDRRNASCRAIGLAALAVCFIGADARAELRDLVITRREPFAGGKAFGDAGPYEKLVGVARFAVDPDHARNRVIVDLVARPAERRRARSSSSPTSSSSPRRTRRRATARSSTTSTTAATSWPCGFFNDAPGGNDPTDGRTPATASCSAAATPSSGAAGSASCCPATTGCCSAPRSRPTSGKPIRGVVRYEMVTDTPAETLPLSRREGHGSYPPTEQGEAEGVLTWRMRETDARVPIPRGQWSLERHARSRR